MHDRPELLEAFKKKDALVKEFEAAKQNLKKAKSLLQMAELNKMKRVLRRMKYCDQVGKAFYHLSTGKTQLSHTLCVTTQMPGLTSYSYRSCYSA